MISETVYLLPQMNQVQQWRKDLAGLQNDRADLGATSATFTEWINSIWELWGDGRAIMKSLQRRVLLLQLLKKQDVLAATAGTAKLIGGFISKMAGEPSFEAAIAGSVEESIELSDAERVVFDLASVYFERLNDLNLVEPGHAMLKLAEILPKTKVYLVGEHELLPNQEAFLRSDCIDLVRDKPYDPVIRGADAASTPTVLLPAGPSALPRMVFDEVVDHLRGDGASGARCSLIATHSAEAMLAQLGPALADEGVNFAARYSKQFAATDFGRAYRTIFLIAKAFAEGDSCPTAVLSDYLRSPYAGVRARKASEFDTRLRGDRRISLQEARDFLSAESQNFETFTTLFENDCDSDTVAKHFIAEATRVYANDLAACAEEIAAANALEQVYEQTLPLVDSPLEIAELLEEKTIDVSSVLDPSTPVQVLISDLNALGIIRRHSFSQVIMSHVTSEDFSMKTPRTALDTLSRKLGVDPERDVLRTGRIYFNALLDAAAESFVVALPVNSGGDEDVYPAFFIEEYFESLRELDEVPDNDEAKRLNIPFGVPKTLYERIRRSGEGKLARNAFSSPDVTEETLIYQGNLDKASIDELLHYREVDGRRLPVLSPSQIELYMTCPYQWFVLRKVKPDALDAQFGPLERGMFVHRVFDETYKRIRDAGMLRVTRDNLLSAQDILSDVFEEVLAKQKEPESEGYIPQMESERNEVEQLKVTLQRNLALHADLLPGYTPVHFEYRIAPEQNIVFAGACINGRIDRIDRNGNGDAVVLDYKGSVSKYACGCNVERDCGDDGRLKEPPQKVQGLIYAAALERLGVGNPAGALYVSYKAEKPQQFVRGSYNEVSLDMGMMADKKSKVECGFSRYLELVEDVLSDEVFRMVAGEIAPAPRFGKDSCAFCPVVNCAMREA